MKKYKVDILPTAVRDIINIRAYIVGRYQDTYNADIVVNDIFNSIRTYRLIATDRYLSLG